MRRLCDSGLYEVETNLRLSQSSPVQVWPYVYAVRVS